MKKEVYRIFKKEMEMKAISAWPKPTRWRIESGLGLKNPKRVRIESGFNKIRPKPKPGTGPNSVIF